MNALIKHVVSLLLIFCIVACIEKPSQPLRLGTNVWPGYEPLYLARDLDYWQSNQVRLIEYPSASEVLRAFRNRSIDAASLTLDEVLTLRELNFPIAVVLVHDISFGADVIIAKPFINSIPELKGKRVGVESGALGAFVLTRALELYGMSLNDIEIINIDVRSHENAYVNDQIDAVVTFEPVRTRLINKNANEIFSSREIPSEIVDVLAVHRDFLKQDPENVVTLINAWFASLDYLREHPDDAEKRIAERLKITPEEVRASFRGIKLPDRLENQQLLGTPDAKLESILQVLRSIMVKNKILSSEVSIDKLLDDSWLNKKSSR